jgi:hypothetical protein
MRKDVLIAMLAILLLGAATVSAKAKSQSCPADQFVKGLLTDGSLSCDVPVDTDTNAATICGADYYLDGDGTCKAVPVDTDTNAETICSAGKYLDGDGTCKTVPPDRTLELCNLYRITGNTPPEFCPKIVFVSSIGYQGNLGGLGGADSKCQSLANGAGLGGSYKAWLSNSTTSAASRLTHSTGPYVLVDGTLIANNWADLTDGSIQNQLDRDENNHRFHPDVWTNTDFDGSIYNVTDHCADWSSSSSLNRGWVGDAVFTDSWWTLYDFDSYGCNEYRNLYCFLQ